MMTHEQVTEWAQDPENEKHPKYANVMSELALIENLKSQMHDHESVETMRRFYNKQGPMFQAHIAGKMCQELQETIQISIGIDPGDEFFIKMAKAIKAITRKGDPSVGPGMVIDEETDRLVCIHDMEVLGKIKLSLQSCQFLIDNFSWELMRAYEVVDALANIRHNLMKLFEDSVNYEFRIKGTPLVDVVEGVDWETMHVKGRTYGNFHVDLCELRGYTRTQKESLN